MNTINLPELKELVAVEFKAMKVKVPDNFDESTQFVDDMGLDSLTISELIARIELRFKILVDDEEWESLTNTQRLCDYLLQRSA